MNKRLHFGLICQRTLFQLITDIWLSAPDSTYLWKLSFSHCNKYPPVISIHLDIKVAYEKSSHNGFCNTTSLTQMLIYDDSVPEEGGGKNNKQINKHHKIKLKMTVLKKIRFPNEKKMTTHGTAVYRLMRSWGGGVQLEMKIRKQLTFICYRKRQIHLKTGVKFYEIGK